VDPKRRPSQALVVYFYSLVRGSVEVSQPLTREAVVVVAMQAPRLQLVVIRSMT
jgi:hypothetical protein